MAGGAVSGTTLGGALALEAVLKDGTIEWQSESMETVEQREHEEEEEKISLLLQPTGDEDRGGGHAGWREAVGAVVYGQW
jgi:hypothetical protein